jgi:site-specific recombinase XerD
MNIKKVPVMKGLKSKVGYLSKDGLKILVDQPNTKTTKGIRNKVMIIMLYDTAARIDELLSLKLKDLNLSGKNPYVSVRGKGNKIRHLPLMDKTVAHLMSYSKIFHSGGNGKDGERHLFYSLIHGDPCRLSTDTVASFLKKYGKEAGKACSDIPDRVHPHLIRHTRAMHLYQDGMPLSYIAEFLGHASMDTTSIYASADLDMMRDALMRVEDSAEDAKPNYKTTDMLKKLCGL